MTPLSVPCKCTLKRSSSIVLSNWKFTWVRRLSLCPCQLIFVTHFRSACWSFHFHHWAKEMWSQQVLRMNCSAALFFFSFVLQPQLLSNQKAFESEDPFQKQYKILCNNVLWNQTWKMPLNNRDDGWSNPKCSMLAAFTMSDPWFFFTSSHSSCVLGGKTT